MRDKDIHVLLVDDEEEILLNYGLVLRYAGIGSVLTVGDSRKVLKTLSENDVSVIILDLIMPHVSGQELLKKIKHDYPDIPIIVMTALNELETAVDCMREGAFDYLVKPVEKDRFVSSVKRAIEYLSIRNEVTYLKHHILADDVENKDAFSSIVTNSSKMKSIFRYAEAIAKTKHPVLVSGETGAGKELFSRAIYTLSGLKGDFVPVNAGGLDDTVFSDTIFGHKKGAYTGAEKDRDGLIAKAAGGVLMLDEIGDLSESSQVKLLRLLEEQRYYPLGSDIPVISDSRIIACTNRDLEEEMATGRFRKDLYYRLSGHCIRIPSLRERKGDIPLLFDCFLEHAMESLSKSKPTYSRDIVHLLMEYNFPGNVRELQTIVFDVAAQHESGELTLENFRNYLKHKKSVADNMTSGTTQATIIMPEIQGRFPTLKEIEDFIISEAMKHANGKQGIAASMLGISRQALNRRLLNKSRDS